MTCKAADVEAATPADATQKWGVDSMMRNAVALTAMGFGFGGGPAKHQPDSCVAVNLD